MSAFQTYHRGVEVEFGGSRYRIEDVTSDYHALLRDLCTKEQRRIDLGELVRVDIAQKHSRHDDLLTHSDDDWEEARRRLQLTEPFREFRRIPHEEASAIARMAGKDVSTLYRWARKFAENPTLTSLIPYRPSGGKGKGRIPARQEQIISEVIESFFKTAPKKTIKATILEVERRCRYEALAPPSPNTIRNRVARVNEAERLKRQGYSKESRDKFDPKPGTYQEALVPLAIAHIDHTLMDVMIVDQETRLEIGRPYITVMIDAFSRMILGFYIALEHPSTLSIGQCILHAVFPKDAWLSRIGIQRDWKCWGFPAKIHSDNGKDFRGKSLRRACEQHRVAHDFRALKNPHWGTPIERYMGTLGQELHKLPGTTMSNIKQRGEYKPGKLAILTLPELEEQVALWITGVYHESFHSGINMSPKQKWEFGLFGDGKSPGCGVRRPPEDYERVRLDFLPEKQCTVQDYGIMWDGLKYYGDALRPYIRQSHPVKGQKYIAKYDPRDVSKIYFLDPNTNIYSEVPNSYSAFGAISIWEVRALRKHVRETGLATIDEDAIFRAREEMRERTNRASAETKRARREREKKRVFVNRRLSILPKKRNAESEERVAPMTSRDLPALEWEEL